MRYNNSMLSTLINSFIKKPEKMYFEGEDGDEEILYVFRKALITNLGWTLLVILLIFVPTSFNGFLASVQAKIPLVVTPTFIFIINALWYLFVFGYAFERFLNWFFNVHIITNKRVVDMDFDHLLHRNISEAPLRNIEDITHTIKGISQTIFNFGDVSVQTAAEKRELEFINVANPAMIQDLLSDLVSEVKGIYGV